MSWINWGGVGVKGLGDGNTRDQVGPVGAGMERESNERDILIEGAIMGLERNLVLGKFPGNHKNDPS